MRPTSTPLADVAASILESVERAGSEKTATASAQSTLRTDLGIELSKLAGELRSAKPAQLTYTDLAEFRRRHGV